MPATNFGLIMAGPTVVSGGVIQPRDLSTHTSANLSITPPGTAFTAGSWNEIAASLPEAANWVTITAFGLPSNATNSSLILELGTGAAGSETAFVQFPAGYRDGAGSDTSLNVPIPRIAAGTRVSLRIRSSARNSGTLTVYAWIGKIDAPTSATALQVSAIDTATALGTTISAPGSANTYGSWTQVVASTSVQLQALFLCFQGAGATTMNLSSNTVQIGTGAAGSETAVITTTLEMSTTELLRPRGPLYFPGIIAAGTRLSARYQRTAASTAPLDLTIVGVPL